MFPSAFERGAEGGFGLLQVLLLLITFTSVILVSVTLMDPVEKPAFAGETNQRLENLKEAIALYRQHRGANPASLDGLLASDGPACAADTNPSSPTYRQLQGWCGPYLDQEFQGSDLFKRDAWGVLLQYNGSTVVSCGPNRVCGDGDDISITI